MITALLNDEFAKRYLATLLAPLGGVETGRRVIGEMERIVVWTVAGNPQDKRMHESSKTRGSAPISRSILAKIDMPESIYPACWCLTRWR